MSNSKPLSAVQWCGNHCGAKQTADGKFHDVFDGFCSHSRKDPPQHHWVTREEQRDYNELRLKYKNNQNNMHHTEHHSSSRSVSTTTTTFTNNRNSSTSATSREGFRYPINTTPGCNNGHNKRNTNQYKGRSYYNQNRHKKQYDNKHQHMKINTGNNNNKRYKMSNNIYSNNNKCINDIKTDKQWSCKFCMAVNSQYMPLCESCHRKKEVKIEYDDDDDAKTIYQPDVDGADEQLKHLVLNEDNNNDNEIIKNAEAADSTPGAQNDETWAIQQRLAEL
eukprot:105973_1